MVFAISTETMNSMRRLRLIEPPKEASHPGKPEIARALTRDRDWLRLCAQRRIAEPRRGEPPCPLCWDR